MNTDISINIKNMNEEEWETRCELAALYRLLAEYRMTDIIYTHISARVPGGHDVFLINRYGVLFHEMKASDLVRIDLNGKIIEDDATTKPVNAAGFTIHSAIHQARPDAKFVIHSHTQAGIAVSAQEDGLLPISQHSLRFHGDLSYHEYEGIAVDLDERGRLAKDLGSNSSMILRNHGLLTVGQSAGEAFSHLYYLERACQIQIAAQSGGAKLHYPAKEVIEKTAAQWRERTTSDSYIHKFWTACLQMIEHQKADYCS